LDDEGVDRICSEMKAWFYNEHIFPVE
jgi:hypothetical protein